MYQMYKLFVLPELPSDFTMHLYIGVYLSVRYCHTSVPGHTRGVQLVQ